MCTIICKSIRPQFTVDCCMVAVVKTADSIASSPLLICRINHCVLSLKSAQHGKSSHIIMSVCSPGRAVQFSGWLSHYSADKKVESIGLYPHLIWRVLWCFVADSPTEMAMSPRFEIPAKFRSKFRFRAKTRDFWSRSRRNHFDKIRCFPTIFN
jgi:hypothetical protein